MAINHCFWQYTWSVYSCQPSIGSRHHHSICLIPSAQVMVVWFCPHLTCYSACKTRLKLRKTVRVHNGTHIISFILSSYYTLQIIIPFKQHNIYVVLRSGMLLERFHVLVCKYIRLCFEHTGFCICPVSLITPWYAKLQPQEDFAVPFCIYRSGVPKVGINPNKYGFEPQPLFQDLHSHTRPCLVRTK